MKEAQLQLPIVAVTLRSDEVNKCVIWDNDAEIEFQSKSFLKNNEIN